MTIRRIDVTIPGDRFRETARKRTTATAVAAPTMVPLLSTCRNSERSAMAVEVMRPLTGDGGCWWTLNLIRKHEQDAKVCKCPRCKRTVHPALVLPRTPRRVPEQPRQQHRQPQYERCDQPSAVSRQRDRRPRERPEGQQCAYDRHNQARPHPQNQRQRAVAATPVLIELIQLRQRIEPGKQGAECKQDQSVTQVERTAGGGPGRVRRERAEPPHVDDPIHTGDRFETKWRHRVEDREDKTDRVRDLKTGGEQQRERLAADEQDETEMEEVARQGGWRVQVPDVTLVL